MEKGKIYKVHTKERIFNGIFIGEEELNWVNNGERVIVYIFVDDYGDELKLYQDDIIELTTAELKNETIAAFNNIYKSYRRQHKIDEEIQQLRSESLEDLKDRLEYKEKLKKSQDLFKTTDIIENLSNVSSWTFNKNNLTEKIYYRFDVYSEKHTTPYGFLERGYDGRLIIKDMECCINQFSVELDDSEIEFLKKNLKHFVLCNIYDHASIRYKNTLNVVKELEFIFNKSSDQEALRKEAELINDWVAKKGDQLKKV